MAENAPTDLTGTSLGEYEIIARIGKGGMGVVYEGRHPLIGKRVAVKVLSKQASRQLEAVDRFLAEARAVNAIGHRGIVDIFGFGALPGGAQYFVMELLEGIAFDEVIRQRAPVGVPDALRWIDEVLDALDAAHVAGVIHRDIKPSNLFLVDGGRGTSYVKLLDFGVAKLMPVRGGVTPQTNVNAVVGTPDYMAPEQARGDPISGLTDLYALGCVLYELLTGVPIFVAQGVFEVMLAHLERAPVPPSRLNRAIPASVDRLVLQLVAKRSEDRPASAHVARQEVHAILAALGANASLPPPSDPNLKVGGLLPQGKRPGKRAKGRLAAVGLLAGSVAVGIWSLRRGPGPEPEPQPPQSSAQFEDRQAATDEPTDGVEAGPPIAAEFEAGQGVSAHSQAVDLIPDARRTKAAVKRDALAGKLVKLKAQLDAREKLTGERDRMLQLLLERATSDLHAAKTPEERKAVEAQLDDLRAHLKP